MKFKILDVCCGGRMFWKNKNHPSALFMDNRIVSKGAFKNGWNPNWCVKPDVVSDFRNIPLKDNLFSLVVFDPPHLIHGNMNGVINKKYGILNKETWLQDIIKGFNECYRVLLTEGVLIFKWSDMNIKASKILKHLSIKPLFGDFTGKSGKTRWMTFMKENNGK